MKIKFTKDYRFAHKGVVVVDYKAGEIVDADDDLAETAIADKVAKPVKIAPERAAPENVAAETAPEVI